MNVNPVNPPRRPRSTRRRGLLVAMLATVFAPLLRAAQQWPRPSGAFRAESTDGTLRELFGERVPAPSDAIRIVAADLAENGAVVPFKIETDLEDVRSITIVATKNPVPLVAQFVPGKTTRGFVATRIKLAESGDVVAVVETAHGLYRAAKHIEVTIGGCGV